MTSIPPRSRGAMRAHASASYIIRQLQMPAQRLIHTAELGAAVLLLGAVVALIWANTPWVDAYRDLWHTEIIVDVGLFSIVEDLEHWVNDGLMAIFFFVVGLEIKRELVHGELSTPRKAALPIVGALGGMVVPASIYAIINGVSPEGNLNGWGIPMATDIAFALGVLALIGRGLPSELRVFLLGLAVADDLGAILVIAIFYTQDLSLAHLGMAAGFILAILAARQVGVRSYLVYIVLGALLWVVVLKSGVHATIAGVALGLLTPARPYFDPASFSATAAPMVQEFQNALDKGDHERAEMVLGELEQMSEGTESPLERLERLVAPWSAFVILPIFALANAGVELSGDVIRDAISSPVTIGVALGLVGGKVIGIFSAVWLSVRLGFASLPTGVGWTHILGVGLLAGIGFTVAIFIAGLAFTDPQSVDEAKIGILAASVVAGVLGFAALKLMAIRNPARQEAARGRH